MGNQRINLDMRARVIGFISLVVVTVSLYPVAYAHKTAVPSQHLGSVVQLRPIQRYIDFLVTKYHFDRNWLERAFQKTRIQPQIIQAMNKPAESLPWFRYRSIFLTTSRIDGGAKFWRSHRAALARAAHIYGVPPSIIVAIIGVETDYGQRMGRWPVMDALTTLAFDYPSRSRYFRRQLTQFLLLAKEHHLNPLVPKGSYAGAMGLGQFMPGSLHHYAVHFASGTKGFEWNNPVDAIGSIANYLSKNGWRRGRLVAVEAQVNRGFQQEHHARYFKTGYSSIEVLKKGFHSINTLSCSSCQDYSLIGLQGRKGDHYWIGGGNFLVIMRYNESPLYAMAVYQLSNQIRRVYGSRFLDGHDVGSGH